MMMKNLKRVTALLLALVMLTVPFSAFAASAGAVEYANALHSLGLFQGTESDRFDEQTMELDRTANRGEALVMFLRLLGREDQIGSGIWQHPFTDVPPWADSYVSYAWTNALTQGVDKTLFGPQFHVNLNQYVTFLLRALGYSDAAGDFSWDNAAAKGQELGLYNAAFAYRNMTSMTRGDLVEVSYQALSLTKKNSTETLAGSLVRLGAVDASAVEALGIPLASGTQLPSDPPSNPPSDDSTQSDAQKVVDLVNEARAAQGLSPLVLDSALTACADIRAVEIGTSFSHTRPDGRSCFTVLSDNGYSYRKAGENIASGYRSPESVVNGWLNSPGHRANILSAEFGRIGVGIDGNDWVQLFSN